MQQQLNLATKFTHQNSGNKIHATKIDGEFYDWSNCELCHMTCEELRALQR